MNPRIKICGLTLAEDARLAIELGAFAIGFIADYPGSPRSRTAAQVAEILRAVGGGARKVGVFVNGARVTEFVREAGIDTVQLHGDETPADCRDLRDALPGIAIWKALRLRDDADLARVTAFAAVTDAILLETYVPGSFGGTGRTGDWALARRARDRVPSHPMVLAGGLTPVNAAAALAGVRPWGLDVSSGVERAPGIKDADKLRAFFAVARSV